MPIKLPLFTDVARAFTYIIPIDGTSYQLRFRYSDRATSWYFDVLSDDGVELATGIRLVANTLLTARHNAAGIFSGALVCFSLTGDRGEPTLDNLGDDFVIFHYTDTEVAEIRASSEDSSPILIEALP